MNKLTWIVRTIFAVALVASVGSRASAQWFRFWERTSSVAYVDVLDVGQGDAILIRAPEGKNALVDAGPDRSVVDRIRELGIERIDLVLVTHHHSDHYGGMQQVIREFRPNYFVATETGHNTSRYRDLLKLVKDSDLKTIVPGPKPREIRLGSVVLTILPQPPEHDDENDNSIGVRFQYGRTRCLLTGDSEDDERAWWIRNSPEWIQDCQVLKLAHHGSRNGIDREWLQLVRPQLALVSLGIGNDYGHPHSETLSLLQEFRIPLLRTDQRGTITLRTDGQRWQIAGTELGGGGLFRRRAVGTPGLGSLLAHEPKSGSSKKTPSSQPSRTISGRRVNLNRATVEEIAQIPGISNSQARHIYRDRPYRAIDDLGQIRSLRPEQLADLKQHATVR
jgi:competence protein ComEC